MVEPVIIVRGLGALAPTGSVTLDSPDLMADLKAILALSEDELALIATALRSQEGFLDYVGIVEIVRDITGRAEEAKRIASFTKQLDRIWRGTDVPLERFVSELQQAMRKHEPAEGSDLSRDQFEEAAKRLPAFIADAASMRRQWDAERVAAGTGLALEDVHLYCDARPVFNKSRTVIEGMVLLTNMKITATGLDGLPTGIEVRLSETQVQDLAKKAAEVEVKLKTLRTTMTDKDILVPALGRRLPQEEGSQ
jgi:hypothetical protein